MQRLTPLLLITLLALLLHGAWEHTHIVLYTSYVAMEGAIPVWMLATLGDLFYTFVILGMLSLAKGNLSWLSSTSWHEYLGAALLGFTLALLVEYKGLYLGRWEYLPAMPIVPFLKVGLSPLMQMTLLTPLSLFLTKRIISFR